MDGDPTGLNGFKGQKNRLNIKEGQRTLIGIEGDNSGFMSIILISAPLALESLPRL